jgi:hypothetical protein
VTTVQDKAQLGLADEAKRQLDEITEKAGFHDKQDAYRLAVAIALAEGLKAKEPGGPRTTYVNIGGLDPDLEIRAAVLGVRDDHEERPVALIEGLAEAGINRIYEHLNAGRSVEEMLRGFESGATLSAS